MPTFYQSEVGITVVAGKLLQGNRVRFPRTRDIDRDVDRHQSALDTIGYYSAAWIST